MNVKDAKAALICACEDLVKEANDKKLNADYRCFTANIDLEEIDENAENVALIAAEISVGAENSEKAVILESAVSVSDGDVVDDEILREVSTLRENLKEVFAKVDESNDANAAFDAIEEETSLPIPEQKVYDNKKFYIYASIFAAAVIIVLLLSKLF